MNSLQFDPFEPHRILHRLVQALDDFVLANSIDKYLDARDRISGERGGADFKLLHSLRKPFVSACRKSDLIPFQEVDAKYKAVTDAAQRLRTEFFQKLLSPWPLHVDGVEDTRRRLIQSAENRFGDMPAPYGDDWISNIDYLNRPIVHDAHKLSQSAMDDLDRLASLIHAPANVAGDATETPTLAAATRPSALKERTSMNPADNDVSILADTIVRLLNSAAATEQQVEDNAWRKIAQLHHEVKCSVAPPRGKPFINVISDALALLVQEGADRSEAKTIAAEAGDVMQCAFEFCPIPPSLLKPRAEYDEDCVRAFQEKRALDLVYDRGMVIVRKLKFLAASAGINVHCPDWRVEAIPRPTPLPTPLVDPINPPTLNNLSARIIDYVHRLDSVDQPSEADRALEIAILFGFAEHFGLATREEIPNHILTPDATRRALEDLRQRIEKRLADEKKERESAESAIRHAAAKLDTMKKFIETPRSAVNTFRSFVRPATAENNLTSNADGYNRDEGLLTLPVMGPPGTPPKVIRVHAPMRPTPPAVPVEKDEAAAADSNNKKPPPAAKAVDFDKVISTVDEMHLFALAHCDGPLTQELLAEIRRLDALLCASCFHAGLTMPDFQQPPTDTYQPWGFTKLPCCLAFEQASINGVTNWVNLLTLTPIEAWCQAMKGLWAMAEMGRERTQPPPVIEESPNSVPSKPSGAIPVSDTPLSPRDLLKQWGILDDDEERILDRLEKRLAVERSKNMNCFSEVQNRARNKPKYLYHPSLVSHVLDSLKTSLEPSSKK